MTEIYCSQCYDMPHRRPRAEPCKCGKAWAPDVYEIEIRGIQSIAGELVIPDEYCEPERVISREPYDARVRQLMASGKWWTKNQIRVQGHFGSHISDVIDSMVESGDLVCEERSWGRGGGRGVVRMYRLVTI